MTDEQYVAYKLTNPASDLPQDVSVMMKCGTKYSTKNTGKKFSGSRTPTGGRTTWWWPS